jgi:dipeptidase D
VSKPLSELEPRSLWGHFDAIRRVPRPSRHEEAIRRHVLDWAAARGFATRVDEVGSVVVCVPATAGHEGAPTVVLQGHFDMVGEKNKDVAFDFATDPIDAFVDGDVVRARGTTLGADNGIGLAAAMAAADDPDVVHGPLELLFTVDEETGLTGASHLQPGFVTGRVLLNLDSEEDGTLYVGCAGGGDAESLLPVTRRAGADADAVELTVRVSGARGGHSGLNIVENRANALKLLARTLRDARAQASLGLLALEGGDKHNAIPREAEATVRIARAQLSALRASVSATAARALEEYGGAEPNLSFAVDELAAPTAPGAPAGLAPLDEPSCDRIVGLLLAIPHGVVSMSRDIPGLVESSTNLARVRLEAERLQILTSSRSSVAAALEEVREQIRACVVLAGGTTRFHGGYPGWRPNVDSPLLATTKDVFRATCGRDPHVTAIHAGLECGIIGERYPGIDMISFGPDIRGAHSPDECVDVPSTARFWTLLRALLARLGGA